MTQAPKRCLYCDGTEPNCGFCDMGKPLDTQDDWDRSWGSILENYSIFEFDSAVHDLLQNQLRQQEWADFGAPNVITVTSHEISKRLEKFREIADLIKAQILWQVK